MFDKFLCLPFSRIPTALVDRFVVDVRERQSRSPKPWTQLQGFAPPPPVVINRAPTPVMPVRPQRRGVLR
jgi:hypothetical protein